MTMISYSQNGEDVLLARAFPPAHRGFYIDVGANHPTHHSVTRHFYDQGWRGINVEPVESVYRALEAERPGDLNLNLALSDHDGEATLYEPAESLGISTISVPFARGLREHGYEYEEKRVPVMTLASLCARHVGDREIDFLKIDVEGHEHEVIQGADWSRWRPKVVLCEATVTPELWEPLLLDSGYTRAANDGINRYYVRREDEATGRVLGWQGHANDDFMRHEHTVDLADARADLAKASADVERLLGLLWEAREQASALERAVAARQGHRWRNWLRIRA